MEHFDYVIVGGGIVGLAVAWTLLQEKTCSVAVLEKEETWASHQTGRNSGVIHSGVYYKPGSLKAALCRKGNTQLVQFCRDQQVPHEICGKYIVATAPSELPGLAALGARAHANGIAARRVTSEELKEHEPHVRCLEALFIPSTGIVSYAAVCQKLVENISARGGSLRLKTKFLFSESTVSGAQITTSKGSILATSLINCAGLHSDRVARAAGCELRARIIPFRGEYYELTPARRNLIRGLIYPVPDPRLPFLGVHFTRMIDGSVHAGPNAVLSLKREGYSRTAFDLRDALDTFAFPGFWRLARRHARTGLEEFHRSFRKSAFLKSLQRMVPELQEEDLIESESGVRAQALDRSGNLIDDFLLIDAPRALHVCNAPSPAATACLEIARLVVQHLNART